jgi:hypothetical protein
LGRGLRFFDITNVDVVDAALDYILPGVFALIACSIPAIYFNHLLKQVDDFRELIKVSKGIARDDVDLKKRCGAFNINDLSKAVGNR